MTFTVRAKPQLVPPMLAEQQIAKVGPVTVVLMVGHERLMLSIIGWQRNTYLCIINIPGQFLGPPVLMC